MYVRLFTNKTQPANPNELEELDCKDYSPQWIPNLDFLIDGRKVKFTAGERVEVFGLYITSENGELLYVEPFKKSFFVDKDSLTIEYTQ